MNGQGSAAKVLVTGMFLLGGAGCVLEINDTPPLMEQIETVEEVEVVAADPVEKKAPAAPIITHLNISPYQFEAGMNEYLEGISDFRLDVAANATAEGFTQQISEGTTISGTYDKSVGMLESVTVEGADTPFVVASAVIAGILDYGPEDAARIMLQELRWADMEEWKPQNYGQIEDGIIFRLEKDSGWDSVKLTARSESKED